MDRRTLVRGAAWSAPVLLVGATALPASASPLSDPRIVSTTCFGSVTRCSTVPAGTVTFTAYVGQNVAPVGSTVTITLPAGLSFVAGAPQTQTVTVGANGLVSVPAFNGTGAAGSYSIQASFTSGGSTVTAACTGTLLAGAGTVVEVTRSVGGGSTAPTISTAPVAISNGLIGATSGDNAGRNTAIVTATGTVAYWGDNFNASRTSPGSLGSNAKTVSAWTSSGSNTAGGAYSTTDGKVYQFYSNGNVTPTVLPVAGISGTILDVQSTDRYSYALTSSGLYYWANATGSVAPTATLVPNTAGALQLSAFGGYNWQSAPNNFQYGGAIVKADGTVCTWSQGFTLSCSASSPSPVVKIEAGPGLASASGIGAPVVWALTASGELYSIGSAFPTTAQQTTWTQRATGVKTFDAWGFQGYTGGVYVTNTGSVIQFNAATGFAYNISDETSYFGGKNVVQVFSSDGTYLALTADKQVYAWGGNLDNTGGRSHPANQSVANAVDLEVWGYHVNNGNFYGGGYVITGEAC
ncbi:hypothetical protein AZH51_06210 [Branchiibius sp. NY16-3462-2]|nr:hypothetical protein AZH51_06210 [Branchiibius sp. NY16-3462-2]